MTKKSATKKMFEKINEKVSGVSPINSNDIRSNDIFTTDALTAIVEIPELFSINLKPVVEFYAETEDFVKASAVINLIKSDPCHYNSDGVVIFAPRYHEYEAAVSLSPEDPYWALVTLFVASETFKGLVPFLAKELKMDIEEEIANL